MKKRIFSILTALCLCLTLLPGAAFAEGETATEVGDEPKLTAALADSTVKSIKLTDNITITESLTVNRAVILDLNGKVLKITGSGSVIKVERGGNLTLTDSNTTAEHKFTSDADGLWVLDEANGTKTVTGGVITGGTGTVIDIDNSVCGVCGGGVYVAGNGTFNMNGGNIVGCTAAGNDSDAFGGGVYVSKGGTFNMSDGSIAGCTAVVNVVYKQACGGGIRNDGSGDDKGHTTLFGTAVIRDCHAKGSNVYGGGISDGGELKISDKVTITGCTITKSGSMFPSAMFVFSGSTIVGGTFDGEVINNGTISGGIFNGSVTNNGSITGGTFNGSVVREVYSDTDFLDALEDENVTTIKLMRKIRVNETETVKELTIDRAVTLVNSSRAPLQLNLPLTIAKDGALTLDGLEGVVSLNPYNGMVVNGNLTVGAKCGASFDGENASLVISEGGTVTTQPAGENTTSGLLSLGENAKLTVNGKVDNQGMLSVSNMENLKLAETIGGELILYGMTINEDYTLNMKGYPLTISSSLNFTNGANLTVKNASKVDATGVTISGGSYYCPVTVGGQPHGSNYVITGGSFYGPVTVKDLGSGGGQPTKVSSGTFYGGIAGTYMISGGTFYNGSFQEGFSLPDTNTEHIEDGRKVVTYKNGEDVYAMQVVNGKASAPDTPVKSGYRFAGWYNGDTKWDFDSNVVTEDLTLTAKWERNHTSAPSTPRYDVAVSDGAHGSVTVSPKSASKGSTVTVTVTPDKGYALETLTVTNKNGSALDLTDKGGGKYTFTMPSSPVTVAATFMDDNTMLNFFVDVPAGAYYYDAVLWAVEGGIVTGTDAVHFSPDASCTRAQLVTFLWRAAGKPVVNYAMNFTDVDGGAYYVEAVRWAASLGIASGYGDGRFGTNDFVTREQVAAMLYRFAKAQDMDTTQGGMAVREFADFESVSPYALEAVDWAVNAGVLKGDNNRLLPQDNCTRAQIVTMLYRALGEK